MKDLGFETIDEKSMGVHTLCATVRAPRYIGTCFFSQRSTVVRTKYPASRPSLFSARSLPDVHLNFASPFRQAGRRRCQWDICPGQYGNSTPSNVRTACTAHSYCVCGLAICRAQGPGPLLSPTPPPAGLPACCSSRRGDGGGSPERTKPNLMPPPASVGSRDSCSAASWQQ